MMQHDQPPASDAVAATWQEYERRILEAYGEELSPDARELARASFYFGSMAMLGMLHAVLARAPGPEAVELVMQGFNAEIASVIEQGAARVN